MARQAYQNKTKQNRKIAKNKSLAQMISHLDAFNQVNQCPNQQNECIVILDIMNNEQKLNISL